MPAIYIKCPVTNRNIPTGFAADDLTSNVFSNNSVGCPHCRGTHTWSNKDAFFVD